MTNEELLSKTIAYLRFPLIVGVVFIHNKMEKVDIQGQIVSFDSWSWLTDIMYYFSSVLPTISVPLFFFISGYLFFYQTGFSKEIYENKIRRRCHTLLIPYLIWNFVNILVLLIQMLPCFQTLFPLLKGYRIDFSEFLSFFWSSDYPLAPASKAPIYFPFWFIRDLMILSVISPLIYFLIRKTKILFILLVGGIWFFTLGKQIGLPPISHQSVFFFPLGAYFSINRINFVALSSKASWAPWIYLLVSILDVANKGESNSFWFHNVGIIVGMIAVTYIVSILIKKQKIHTNQFLSDASFFVFALHGIFISKLMKILVMTIHPQSPVLILFIYFMVPIATILICLWLYRLLSGFFPKAMKIATGGR